MLRRATIIGCIVLAASMLAPVAAFADDTTLLAELLKRIEQLEAQVAGLKKQVDQLATAQGAAPKGAVAAAPAADRERVMQVMRIEPIPVDESRRPEVDKLRSEADELDDQARQLDSQRAQLQDERSGRSGRDRDYSGDDSSSGDQIAALRKNASQLRGQASRKRGDADDIEREMDTRRQRIGGWDGVRIVVLTTKGDLSRSLTELNPGDFITWTGERTRLTNQTDEYDVKAIEEVAAPEGFKPAPPGTSLPRGWKPVDPKAPADGDGGRGSGS